MNVECFLAVVRIFASQFSDKDRKQSSSLTIQWELGVKDIVFTRTEDELKHVHVHLHIYFQLMWSDELIPRHTIMRQPYLSVRLDRRRDGRNAACGKTSCVESRCYALVLQIVCHPSSAPCQSLRTLQICVARSHFSATMALQITRDNISLDPRQLF